MSKASCAQMASLQCILEWSLRKPTDRVNNIQIATATRMAVCIRGRYLCCLPGANNNKSLEENHGANSV